MRSQCGLTGILYYKGPTCIEVSHPCRIQTCCSRHVRSLAKHCIMYEVESFGLTHDFCHVTPVLISWAMPCCHSQALSSVLMMNTCCQLTRGASRCPTLSTQASQSCRSSFTGCSHGDLYPLLATTAGQRPGAWSSSCGNHQTRSDLLLSGFSCHSSGCFGNLAVAKWLLPDEKPYTYSGWENQCHLCCNQLARALCLGKAFCLLSPRVSKSSCCSNFATSAKRDHKLLLNLSGH